MSEGIEAGRYNVYQGSFENEFYCAIIKTCLRRTTLVAYTKELPEDPTKEISKDKVPEFIAAMMNDGQLYDTYMTKKVALQGYEELKEHNRIKAYFYLNE